MTEHFLCWDYILSSFSLRVRFIIHTAQRGPALAFRVQGTSCFFSCSMVRNQNPFAGKNPTRDCGNSAGRARASLRKHKELLMTACGSQLWIWHRGANLIRRSVYIAGSKRARVRMCVWLILPQKRRHPALVAGCRLFCSSGADADEPRPGSHPCTACASHHLIHPLLVLSLSQPLSLPLNELHALSLHSIIFLLIGNSSPSCPLYHTHSPFVLPLFPSCHLVVPLNTNTTWERGVF